MEPITLMPPSTVSKTGRLIALSLGRDQHQAAAAPQAGVRLLQHARAGGQHDRHVGPAERLDLGDRVAGGGVDGVGGAQLLGQAELVGGDVDGDGLGAEDLRVLLGQMAQAADAEDGGALGGAQPGDLDGLVSGHTRAGQRGGLGGETPSGTGTT
nr:hypothetical protein GCM10020093_019390 [Planobispora longispora]